MFMLQAIIERGKKAREIMNIELNKKEDKLVK